MEATQRTRESSGGRRTHAVRKRVTALFADLVGSTAFSEQVDPEAARAALAPYFDILQTTIEAHAGTVSKFLGDGVMAVFGVPEIAEDDPLRAVAAGLELQRRFAGFAAQVRDRHGVELGLRVGINTGELVVGDGDADLVGDVLNTAARLEAACAPGRVMVGEDTWRETRASVAYEVLGEVRVKGKVDAIATFQVVDGTDGVTDDVTPFVGREHELALLLDAFGDARRSQAARLVTVVGAPGVGKTRLATEVRAAVDARSFDLRFERRGTTTFTPVVELLREITGSDAADGIARLVADHAESERLASVLESFVGRNDPPSTEESFWAVRRLVEHLAADGPLMIVVDDIQWAEPLFWDLLDHLVEWAAAPVLIVALARPELRDLRPELAQAGGRVTASVALEGLDAATTRELAARLLDTDELPHELVERIPDSTDGNPLFVRELVQMLVDDGVLERSGDRWSLTIDADAIEVPPTVMSLLASRVERLPESERHVVELASVIGTEFDRGLLASIAGEGADKRLGAVIDRLRRKDLVEPSGTWVGDSPVYRFHHVLVRDAAYRRLLKGRRADLHEQVGRHLDAHGGEGDEVDVTIAHHYEQVHRYRAELGTGDDATAVLAADATARLRAAAERAIHREDLSAAGGYARRALALTSDPDERSELLLLGCEALLSSGDVAGGVDLVDQLDELSGGDRLGAWADCFRAQLWSLTDSDRLAEAAALADVAAERLDGHDDQAGVAKGRLVRASVLARMGRVGECEAELDLALNAARHAGDRRRTVAVLGAAPLAALWGPSPVARAGGRCLDVLRLLRITTSSPAVEATSIRCQGMLEALRGRFESARDKLEQSRTTARELGLRQGLYETELFAGFVELWAGAPEAAETHLRLASEGLGALGIGADAGQARAQLAAALLQTGQLEAADSLATSALETAGQNLQTAIASRAVLAEIRAAQGRDDEATTLADAAIALAEPTDITLDRALAFRAASRVALAVGDEAAAARWHDASRELLDAKGVTGLAGIATQPASVDAIDATAATEHPSVAVRAGDARQSATVGVDDLEVRHRAIDVDRHRPDASEDAHAVGVPPVFANAAWQMCRRAIDAFMANDRAAFDACLHAEFGGATRERLGSATVERNDSEFFADAVFRLRGEGAEIRVDTELVAIRADELCLYRIEVSIDGSDVEQHAVIRITDGLIDRWTIYDADDLHGALTELDRRWVERGGPSDIAEIWRHTNDVFFERQRDALRPVLTDDFVEIDHRQLGKGRRSADQYVVTTNALAEFGSVAYFAGVFERAGDVHLIRMHARFTDGNIEAIIAIGVLRDGKLARVESFAIDDFGSARQRFDELATAERGPFSTTTDAPELMNAAWKIARAFGSHLAEQRYDEMDAMTHDDYVVTFHGRLSHLTPEVPAEASTDYYRDLISDLRNQRTELVASRGDRHCLIRYDFERDGWQLHQYLLFEGSDRQVRRADWYDLDQLTDALRELDRRWLDSLGVASDHPVRRILHVAYSTDIDEIAPLVDPDVEYREHRALAFDDGGIGQLLTAGSTLNMVEQVVIPVVHELDDSVIVVERQERRISGDVSIAIGVTRIRDGLIIGYDAYDVADLEDALRQAGEYELARRGDTGGVRNRACEIVDGALERLDAGDRVGYSATLANRYEILSRERSVPGDARWDRSSFLDYVFELRDEGGLVITSHLIETRGDHLTLRQVTSQVGGDRFDLYFVTETDDEQIVRDVTFDDQQLDEARAELERRWRELSASHVTNRASASLERLVRHIERGDWDAVRVASHPAYVAEWRTDVGRAVGTVGIDEAMAIYAEITPQGAALRYSTIAVRADELCVGRFEFDADGFVSERYAVQRLEGDQWIATVWFDGDRLHEALDELDDQWVEHAGGPPRLVELGRRFRTALGGGTLADIEALAHDELVAVDHRHLGLGERSRTQWIESFFALVDNADIVVTEVIEHTDDVRLVRGGLITRDGAAQLGAIGLSRVTADGRCDVYETFDADQLDDARRRFDELTSDRISEYGIIAGHFDDGPPDGIDEVDDLSHRLEALADRFVDHFFDADFHRLRDQLFEPTFERQDRRLGVSFPTVDLDGFRDAALALDGGAPTIDRGPLIAVRPNAYLGRATTRYADGGSNESLIVLVEGVTRRIERMVVFDVDDLAAALDELDRQTRWGDAHVALTNGFPPIRRAFLDGDADALTACFTADFVAIDRRPLGLGSRNRDEWVDSAIALGPGTHAVLADVIEWHGDVGLVRIGLSTPDGSTWTYLQLTRFDGPRGTYMESFGPDQLDLARLRFAELDSRQRPRGDGVASRDAALTHRDELIAEQAPAHAWTSSMHVRAAERLETFKRRWNSNDLAGMRSMVTDDLEIWSYRTLGPPARLQGAEAIESALGIQEFWPRWRYELIAVASDRVNLAGMYSSNEAGDELAMLTVTYTDSMGRAERMATFDIGELGRATVVMEEWANGDPGAAPVDHDLAAATAATPAVLEPSNDAVRIVDEVLDACRRLDRAALDTLVHDDFVSSRRERRYEAMSIRDLDKQGYIADVFDSATFTTDDGGPSAARQILATAGDHLYLARGELAFGDDVVEYLVVTECRDGRLVSLTWFDVDDLNAAADELDRRWLERGGPSEALRAGLDVRRVMATGTPDDLAQIIAPGFESVDHRPLGFGRRDRNTWIESMAPLVGDVVQYGGIERAEHGVVMMRAVMVVRSSGDVVVDGISVVSHDGERLLRMELFDHGQFELAGRRFDELADGARSASSE